MIEASEEIMMKTSERDGGYVVSSWKWLQLLKIPFTFGFPQGIGISRIGHQTNKERNPVILRSDLLAYPTLHFVNSQIDDLHRGGR
jgi:hypothetical protein